MNPLPPLPLADIEALITRFAPVVCLHPDEAWKMSSVEWYFAQGSLVRGGEVQPWDHTAATLPVGPADGTNPYWLTLPVAARPGHQDTATSYVNVKPSSDGLTTWLQFWFFYPYNGPGVAHLNGLLFDTITNTGDTVLGDMGAHTGDWEHVTLGVDAATKTLTSVYLSQHAGGVWYRGKAVASLARRGEQVVVYASKNGHASYSQPGKNYTNHVKIGPLPPLGEGIEFFLRNDTAPGEVLDCATHYVIVSSPWTTDAAWLNFPYRWGPAVTAYMTEATLWHCLMNACGFLVGSALTALLHIATGPLIETFVKQDEDGPAAIKTKSFWNDPGIEV